MTYLFILTASESVYSVLSKSDGMIELLIDGQVDGWMNGWMD